MAIARAAASRALQDIADEPPANSADPTMRKPDAALTFERASRAVRLAITLETRIAAGPAIQAKTRSEPITPDPRRIPLRRALRLVTETHPDRAALHRDSEERLDHELCADPDASIPDILFAICEDLGLEIDLARLPDEFLPRFHDQTHSGDKEIPVAGIEPGEIRTPPLQI